MAEEVIHIENIDFSRGNVLIFESLSVSFPGNVVSVIMGPAGCGKSTLLKIASGIIPPDRGEVYFKEKNISKISNDDLIELRKSHGFAFQDAALWANKSVFQNLSLPLEIHFHHISQEEIKRRVEDIVRRTGYKDELTLRPSQLSSGEKKVVSIARALINDPSTVFMDDPTSALDRDSYDRVVKLIRELKQKNKTVLISTHDPELASMVADYLFIMKRGAFLEQGRLEKVVETKNKEVIAILTDVLSRASTYDTDILDLLQSDE